MGRTRAKHYRLDRADVRRWTQRDPEREEEDARDSGEYAYHQLVIVPIADVRPVSVWHGGRIERIREALRNGTPLPAIHATKAKDGKWDISDGIHRYNASVEAGFTHIPVIDTVVVKTPELRQEPEPERPVLPRGTWVVLRKTDHDESKWAMVDEYLNQRWWKGTHRHRWGPTHSGRWIRPRWARRTG